MVKHPVTNQDVTIDSPLPHDLEVAFEISAQLRRVTFFARRSPIRVHAIISSVGTDGDILPYLGVGTQLLARGHRVTFFAAGNYADLIESHGIAFRELIPAERMRALLGNADMWHPFKAARHTARWQPPHIKPQYQMIDAVAAEEPCVHISNPAVLAPRSFTRHARNRFCHLILQPWMIFSAMRRRDAWSRASRAGTPRFLHTFFYHGMDLAAGFLFGPALNRVLTSAARIRYETFCTIGSRATSSSACSRNGTGRRKKIGRRNCACSIFRASMAPSIARRRSGWLNS